MDYLTENRRDVMWFHDPVRASGAGLRIVGIGYPDTMPPQMVNRPNGTDDYLFMHFPCPIRAWHDGAVRDFPAHTFFLWTPGNRHTFGHPEHRWCHYWLHCSGVQVKNLVHASTVPLNRPIFLNHSNLADQYLKQLHDELKNTREQDFTILYAYLALWVRMLDRSVHPEKQNSRLSERVWRSVQYMAEHLAMPLSLEEIARTVNLSVSRFSAEFHRDMGISPIAFLLEQRLSHAVMLLRDQNLSIQQVANQSGFSDPFYFSRQFRRRYEMSPSEYRQQFPLLQLQHGK